MSITDLVYIDSTGFHYSDYPAFLSWLQNLYRSIYGADVYLEADSQDGQFVAALAKAFFDTAAQGASDYNSFSPATAQGVGLSRVVKINGITRRVPTHSTVELTIVGQGGTVITNGVVIDTLNQKWILPTTTIPGSGTVAATAVAEDEGAVTAAANTVNTIFTPTRGWQTANNAAEATPGVGVETDSELRARQRISTANPSLTVFDGTVGGVGNVTGVTKVRGYENDTGSTDSNGILAHSISLVVVGGDDVDICQEIALHKTPGTGTFGDTSETVYDAHGMPLDIAFERAVVATISAEITIAADVGWSSDFEALIQDAVAAFVNAGRIGDPVLYTKLFGPAYLYGTAPGLTYTIATLEIQKNSGGFAAANLTLDWDENPVCDPADVTVIVT